MIGRRLVACVVALVAFLGGAISAAAPASAASLPWVPPSMGTGTDDVRGLVTGSSIASPWNGAKGWSYQTARTESWVAAHPNSCTYRAAWGTTPNGVGVTVSAVSASPSGSVNCGSPAANLTVWTNGVAGQVEEIRCSVSGWKKGTLYAYGGSGAVYFLASGHDGASVCPGETVLGARAKTVEVAGTQFGQPMTYLLDGWEIDLGLAPLTVTVTCYDGSNFSTVTGSASGATVTRPDCPAGSAQVGVTVSKGGTVLSSWSAPLTDSVAVSCTASGTCAVVVAAAGVPCTAGLPQCDWWDAGGSASEASSKGLSCVWLPDPTMALSGGVQLTMMDCSDAKGGGQGGTSGSGGEQSEDQDTNLITKAINAAKSAIVEAVNRVKSAVDLVKSVVEAGTKAIQKAIADGISTVATKLIELIQAVKDGGGGDGGGGGDEGTGLEPGGCNDQQLANPANPVEWVRAGMVCAFVPAPGTVDGLVQQAKDAIGAPVKPWTDAMTSVASAWTAAPAGCQGPAITIPIPPMQPYVLRPLDACQEPMRTVAGLSRVVATVLLLSAAAWSALRAIAAGLGYQS